MTALKDKRILIPAAVTALLLIGIAIPKLTVHDSVELTDAEKSCAQIGVSQQLDSPFQRVALALGKSAVIEKKENSLTIKSYTIFHIPLPFTHLFNRFTTDVICDWAATSTIPSLPITDGTNVDGFGQFRDSKVTDGRKSFISDPYGISFTYSSNYFVFDARSANADGENYGIGVVPDSTSLRQALANEHNEPGMIPRIGIFFYHDDSNASLEEIARKRIIRANGESAPIPTFTKTTAGGVPAIRYTDASGLYSRDTVLLGHGDWMVQIAADDATYFKADLDSILSSITFH